MAGIQGLGIARFHCIYGTLLLVTFRKIRAAYSYTFMYTKLPASIYHNNYTSIQLMYPNYNACIILHIAHIADIMYSVLQHIIYQIILYISYIQV